MQRTGYWKRWMLFSVFFLMSSAQTQAQRSPGSNQTLQAQLDSLLARPRDGAPGFSGHVVLLDSSGVLAERVQGLANVELRVPLSDSSVYRIASISKQFTGLLTARLAARGALDINAPVGTYLPGVADTPAGAVSLRHLLGHTSGLPPNPDYLWEYVSHRYGWNWRENRPSSEFSADSFVTRFAREEALRPPGTRWEYCNSCYVLAGLVMEAITGTSFPALLRQEILDPLGMDHTGIEELDQLLLHRAYGYEQDADGQLRPHTRFRDLAAIGPAGGMYTTMGDLVKWARAVFLSGAFLGPEERDLYFTTGRNNSALGLTVAEPMPVGNDTVSVTYHTGEIAGVHALVMFVPQARTAILVLSNIGFSYPHRSLRAELLRLVISQADRAVPNELQGGR